MTYFICNGIEAKSTKWNNGTEITPSNTYTIEVDTVTNDLDVYVYFLTGKGENEYVTSYNGVNIETSTLWAATGWEGPYTYATVIQGTAEIGNAGPDSYGSIVLYKAVFKNVPSAVKAIGIIAYDGNEWTDTYYWKCGSEPSSYTIRCYINNTWQDCIIKYYDGTNWIDCIPKYYDGTQWIECSF